MSGVCFKCANDLDDNYVSCQGFCGATFHPECSSTNVEFLAEVIRQPQCMWFCASCTKLMADLRFRKSVRAAFDAGRASVTDSETGVIEQLKAELLTELKTEIRASFTALLNSNSFTPVSSRPPLNPVAAQGRRLMLHPDPIKPPKPILIEGAGSPISPSIGVKTVSQRPIKFWLYLSRISPEVTAEQICALGTKCLGTTDIEAYRLVAKGRDVSTLSFVSFKVGFSTELKNKALAPSTWPQGIQFREFIDQRANFWSPEVQPSQPPELNHLSRNSSPENMTLME